MDKKAKIIDLTQRRKFIKYRKWFELYAKFLSLFKRRPQAKAKINRVKRDIK